MTSAAGLIGRLEQASDWLSPIVVKEVRQVMRGREFMSSFAACLLTGLLVAFFGAADSLTGTGTSGGWTFVALMTTLTFLGIAVVPLSAFSALRNERMEQTLELMTLTALTPRRVVIGKLLAQGVKLATLFAAVAPFITMSFLLGGIDFVTIVVSVTMVFVWSLWASAFCLFLSTLLKSRAMSGLVFGGVAIVLLFTFGFSRIVFMFATRGGLPVASMFGIGMARAQFWWSVAIGISVCLVTMANLVLLAENRLSLSTEDKVTPLRVGFFLQFLLILGWTLSYVKSSPPNALGVLGGLHLALVATFVVTEDMVVPRRVLMRMRQSSAPRRWLLAMFRPGGGRGALYVLVQMALLIGAAAIFRPGWSDIRWILATCGYVCFFTGVLTVVFRLLKPTKAAAVLLRVGLLLLLPASMLLPDLIHYIVWQPETLSLAYSMRHLVNPFRTLANWPLVETREWLLMPLLFGVTGVVTYIALIAIGAQVTMNAMELQTSLVPADEPDRVPAEN